MVLSVAAHLKVLAPVGWISSSDVVWMKTWQTRLSFLWTSLLLVQFLTAHSTCILRFNFIIFHQHTACLCSWLCWYNLHSVCAEDTFMCFWAPSNAPRLVPLFGYLTYSLVVLNLIHCIIQNASLKEIYLTLRGGATFLCREIYCLTVRKFCVWMWICIVSGAVRVPSDAHSLKIFSVADLVTLNSPEVLMQSCEWLIVSSLGLTSHQFILSKTSAIGSSPLATLQNTSGYRQQIDGGGLEPFSIFCICHVLFTCYWFITLFTLNCSEKKTVVKAKSCCHHRTNDQPMT